MHDACNRCYNYCGNICYYFRRGISIMSDCICGRHHCETCGSPQTTHNCQDEIARYKKEKEEFKKKREAEFQNSWITKIIKDEDKS